MKKKLIITGVLFLVLVGLLSFILFYEKGNIDKEKQSLVLVETNDTVGQIKSITISARGTDGFTMENSTKEGWIMTKPANYKIDQTKLESILDGLKLLEAKEVVDETPASLTNYGLDEPMITMEVKFIKGGETIKIGDYSFDNASMYVLKGSGKEVYMAETAKLEPYLVDIEAIRDHQIVSFDSIAVDGMEIQFGDNDLIFQKVDDVWKLDGDKTDLDKDKVFTLVSDILNVKADGFYQVQEGDTVDFTKDVILRAAYKNKDKVYIIEAIKDINSADMLLINVTEGDENPAEVKDKELFLIKTTTIQQMFDKSAEDFYPDKKE